MMISADTQARWHTISLQSSTADRSGRRRMLNAYLVLPAEPLQRSAFLLHPLREAVGRRLHLGAEASRRHPPNAHHLAVCKRHRPGVLVYSVAAHQLHIMKLALVQLPPVCG